MDNLKSSERRINEWLLTVYNADTAMAVGVYSTFNEAEMVGVRITNGRDQAHRGYGSFKVKAYEEAIYA